jgi:hypothetical protein
MLLQSPHDILRAPAAANRFATRRTVSRNAASTGDVSSRGQARARRASGVASRNGR